ncbi:hypothetical protein Ahy_A04g018793 [Arachis hypogaea]|uniref:Zinc finger PMZ-type domain-containing protein n=1 Tax=Arachis hypogaea TaxID=3818 RepID=A0A445DEK5_ARAHY|nr:hypothetical protein Ahy_A04g018793 [Arachis hypogaea]
MQGQQAGNVLTQHAPKVQQPRIELYVKFEHIATDEVKHDIDVQDDRVEAYLGMNDDSDEEFEATYEAGDEDEDDDGGGEALAKTLVVLAAIDEQQICFVICAVDPNDREFRIGMKLLKGIKGPALAKACGQDRWELAFDEGHQWGHMTMNLVRCITSVLKGARNLTILALVQAIYYRLNELFTRKNIEAYQCKRARFTFFEFATQRIEANMQRAGNIVVHRFDRRNKVFEVREMTSEKVLVVDLARRRCDHGNFQVERLPCHHASACCANQRLDWQVYVSDVYKMSEIWKVYRVEFVPLGNTETWPNYPGLTMVTNPALGRKSKDCPKSTRYLNEIDSRKMRGPRVCRLSRRQDYSHSRCSQCVTDIKVCV